MNSHVHCQLTPLVEPCATLVAPERFLFVVVRVGSHVVPDVALEGFATDVTLVQLLVLVKGEDVTLKGVRPGISLIAQVALVLPGPNVHFHVRLEVATEIHNSSAKEERHVSLNLLITWK